MSVRVLSVLALALIACSPTAPTHGQAAAITPIKPIKLFDGKSLANFETWLVDHHLQDPQGVFSVGQIDGVPAIKVTGQVWGGFITKQAYRNYRLIVEYRWGGPTWGDRAARTRDSGMLLHSQGRLGNTAKDFNGPWLRSIEFQIIEGGVGDIIMVSGFDDNGAQIRPSMTVRVRKDRDGENVYDPNGQPTTFSSGRINWWGRSEDWTDTLGFRGPNDVESPGLQWTHLEAIVEGGNLKYFVNGKLVNEGTGASFTEGRIMFQSEGAEIHFRRIDLEPL